VFQKLANIHFCFEFGSSQQGTIPNWSRSAEVLPSIRIIRINCLFSYNIYIHRIKRMERIYGTCFSTLHRNLEDCHSVSSFFSFNYRLIDYNFNVDGFICVAIFLKSPVFWDVMPSCPLKVNRSFGGTYHRHHQGRRIIQAINQGEST
jgi:hypothetical protein